MMKRISRYLGLGTLACLLIACPYTSTVPIDAPSVKVDKKLMGKWVKTSDLSNENPDYYIIEKQDKFIYRIVNNTYNSMDSTYGEEVYISHISDVDGVSFMNMQKDGTGEYYIHKIVLGEKALTFIEVTENIDEKFNTSEELKAFIQKHMHLSFFYTKEESHYTKQ